MKNVFLPQFMNKTEIKWTRGFIEILKTTHPSTARHALKVYMNEDMKVLAKRSPNLCWRHLVRRTKDTVILLAKSSYSYSSICHVGMMIYESKDG